VSFGREQQAPGAIGLVDELLHIRNAFPALRFATEAAEQLAFLEKPSEDYVIRLK